MVCRPFSITDPIEKSFQGKLGFVMDSTNMIAEDDSTDNLVAQKTAFQFSVHLVMSLRIPALIEVSYFVDRFVFTPNTAC